MSLDKEHAKGKNATILLNSISKRKLYWIIQIVCWFLFAVLGIVVAQVLDKYKEGLIPLQFIVATLMLLATHVLRHALKELNWARLRIDKMLIRLVLGSLLVSVVVSGVVAILDALIFQIRDSGKLTSEIFFLSVIEVFIWISLWILAYFSTKYFREYKREEIEKWKLQSALKDAELIALKAQINPHFLFNALNNIRALILEDKEKSRDMVSHLSELLRYSIQFNNNEKVTVEDELEIVEKYLALESIHYEERLSYQILTQPSLEDCKIPPMIIQLMAENAIKHGISQLKDGGDILISISEKEEDMVIEVANSGSLKKKNGKGIGLKNAVDRIRILFEQEPDFELTQKGSTVRSVLTLPITR